MPAPIPVRRVTAGVHHPERFGRRTDDDSVVELRVDRGLTSGKLDLYALTPHDAVDLATDLLAQARLASRLNVERAARSLDGRDER